MPSRKIISIFILCSALVTSIILVSGNRGATRAVNSASNSISGLLSKGPGLNAGIPENQNWQSDLSPFTLKSAEVGALAASSTSNLTDQISQSLMANYFSLRESGNLNNTSADTLINQALEFTEASSASSPKYSTANIVVSPDNSQSAVRAYGTDLGNAFKINRPAITKNEMELLSEILQSQDKARVSELVEVAGVYRRLVATMSNIKVPSSYTSLHIEMLNNLSDLANAIDSMAVIFDDPIRSMQGVSSYQISSNGFASVLEKIRLKIIKEGKVIYKQGESGYYLYYGI